MPIESTISTTSEPKEQSFPCLMQHKLSDIIVLFVEYGKGTVIGAYLPNYEKNIGYYSSLFSMEEFEPFHGEITLKNSL